METARPHQLLVAVDRVTCGQLPLVGRLRMMGADLRVMVVAVLPVSKMTEMERAAVVAMLRRTQRDQPAN